MKNYFSELKRLPAILHNEGNSWKHVTEILFNAADNENICLKGVKAQSHLIG